MSRMLLRSHRTWPTYIVMMMMMMILIMFLLTNVSSSDTIKAVYDDSDSYSSIDAATIIDDPINVVKQTKYKDDEEIEKTLYSETVSDSSSTSEVPKMMSSTNDTAQSTNSKGSSHKNSHISNRNAKKSSSSTIENKQENTSKKSSTSTVKLKQNVKLTNSNSSRTSSQNTNTGVPTSNNNTTTTRDRHTNYNYSRNENENGVMDEAVKLKLEEERLNALQEAKRRRQQQERERESKLVTRTILHASATEQCDWKSQPLSFLRGDVCGSYYKVLGLNRKKSTFDKSDIKKLYRQKSLSVHPDKNPSIDATTAFNVVQQAYECLVDDNCRMQYDDKLRNAEEIESIQRKRFRDKILNKSLEVLSQAHFYASIAANYLYQSGIEVWNIAGEWEVEWMGYPRPIGRFLLSIALLLKGRVIVLVHGISYIVLRLNYEIAKSKGVF